VDTSLLLDERLPATIAAARAGDLSWDKATTLAQLTASLDLARAREVEARVLPRAARRTPAQHRDAVRRAVDRVDPEGADERRRQARKDIRLIATHHGAGMGELFARPPSEQLDLVWNAASAWARATKAAGDDRPLDELRVAALVDWATRYLQGRDMVDPPTADATTSADARQGDDIVPIPQDGDTAPSRPEGHSVPSRHGRPVRLELLWDLSSLLGVTGHCGEILGSGATIPPAVMAGLVRDGGRIRRMLVDPATGELLDLTRTWPLPQAAPGPRPPMLLHLVVTDRVRDAIVSGDLDGLDEETRSLVLELVDAIAALPAPMQQTITELLAHADTARSRQGPGRRAAVCRTGRVRRAAGPAPRQPHRGGESCFCRRHRPHRGAQPGWQDDRRQPRRTEPALAPAQDLRRLDLRPTRDRRLRVDQSLRTALHGRAA
jgi:hypothetical protein